MKLHLKTLALFFGLYTFELLANQSITIQNPLLVVILMVKNEAPVIEKTLEPYLKAGIDSYLILDTGSTDDTIAKTKQLFLDYHVQHGYIIEQPFIDFSTSRNYALECAEQLFPNAAFFFMIDAEWYLQNIDLLLKFCQLQAYNFTNDAFAIRVCFENVEYYVRRLFKADKKIRFIGVVHEYAQAKSYTKLPSEISINWIASCNGNHKSKARWQQDKELLLKEYEKNPTNLRTIYYLGQTYFDLQEFKDAAFWYQKRFDAIEYTEEKFISGCQLGAICDHLKNAEMALHYYTIAHTLNPDRAEPLAAIALYHLRNKNYKQAFLFAQQAAEKPYPHNALLINKTIYLYTRYIILAIASWNILEYEICKQALQKALEYNPTDIYLLEMKKELQNYH